MAHRGTLAQPRTPVALGVPVFTEALDESFVKACAAEFLATLLFLFIAISTAGTRFSASSRAAVLTTQLLLHITQAAALNNSTLTVALTLSCCPMWSVTPAPYVRLLRLPWTIAPASLYTSYVMGIDTIPRCGSCCLPTRESSLALLTCISYLRAKRSRKRQARAAVRSTYRTALLGWNALSLKQPYNL